MYHSFVDFAKISKALTETTAAVRGEEHISDHALKNLQQAQEELSRALSFSASVKTKLE